MKKLNIFFLTLALCLLYVVPAHAVLVAVDGNLINFDVPPYIDENNRTMVPIRFIAEEMGAEVDYNFDNPMKKEVYISQGDINIVATIDSTQVKVNGETKTAPTAARVVNGRTMVPLRFCEYLGVSVTWKPESATAHIFTTEKTEEEKQAIMVDTAMKKSDKYQVDKVKVTYFDGSVWEKTLYRTNGLPISIPDNPSTTLLDESKTIQSIELVNIYGVDFVKLTQVGNAPVGISIGDLNDENILGINPAQYKNSGMPYYGEYFDKNPDGSVYALYNIFDNQRNKINTADKIYISTSEAVWEIPNPMKK